MQDLETPGHRVVQASVNARKHHHTLLNQGHRGADRLVGVLVAQLLEGSLDDTLTGIHQEPQKLEQRRARRVERHRHGELAHVIDKSPAFHLDHFGRLEVDRLPARATLELQEGGDVLDVGAIQQSAQGTCSGPGEAPNHVRQANGVCAAPGHERELYDPIEFLMPGIIRFPVAVERQGLAGRFIDAQNVRAEVFVFDVEVGVDFKDGPKAILVVAGGRATLDLVVGNRCLAVFGIIGIPQVNVDIHARLNALLVLHLRDVLNVRLALGGVEICCSEWQIHVVNRHELRTRTAMLRVPHELHVLTTAQR